MVIKRNLKQKIRVRKPKAKPKAKANVQVNPFKPRAVKKKWDTKKMRRVYKAERTFILKRQKQEHDNRMRLAKSLDERKKLILARKKQMKSNLYVRNPSTKHVGDYLIPTSTYDKYMNGFTDDKLLLKLREEEKKEKIELLKAKAIKDKEIIKESKIETAKAKLKTEIEERKQTVKEAKEQFHKKDEPVKIKVKKVPVPTPTPQPQPTKKPVKIKVPKQLLIKGPNAIRFKEIEGPELSEANKKIIENPKLQEIFGGALGKITEIVPLIHEFMKLHDIVRFKPYADNSFLANDYILVTTLFENGDDTDDGVEIRMLSDLSNYVRKYYEWIQDNMSVFKQIDEEQDMDKVSGLVKTLSETFPTRAYDNNTMKTLRARGTLQAYEAVSDDLDNIARLFRDLPIEVEKAVRREEAKLGKEEEEILKKHPETDDIVKRSKELREKLKIQLDKKKRKEDDEGRVATLREKLPKPPKPTPKAKGKEDDEGPEIREDPRQPRGKADKRRDIELAKRERIVEKAQKQQDIELAKRERIVEKAQEIRERAQKQRDTIARVTKDSKRKIDETPDEHMERRREDYRKQEQKILDKMREQGEEENTPEFKEALKVEHKKRKAIEKAKLDARTKYTEHKPMGTGKSRKQLTPAQKVQLEKERIINEQQALIAKQTKRMLKNARPQCKAMTKKGKGPRCRRKAIPDSDFCKQHSE